MSKILIIGNGPSALENKYGEIIDSDRWDVVMRFNRWEKDDDGIKHEDYSEYIGTRCDYWMVNDLRIKVAIERNNNYGVVIVYCPKFKMDIFNTYDSNLLEKIEKSYSNVKIIPSSYEDFINTNIVDFKPKWPSTGVIGIYFGVRNFDEVYLHGFDTYDNKYDNMHYFENKPNKYKFNSSSDHEPKLEKEFIKIMMKKYNVKKLTSEAK
jgi:hypothetical protein